jgi:hypothetical protein
MPAEDIATVFRKLDGEIDKLKTVTMGGLLAGGYVILRQAQKWVPVEHGKLRASGYVLKAQKDPSAVEIGFSASYAIYVHENLEQKLKGQPRPSGLGKYWGPNGRPRFLSAAATETRQQVLDKIAEIAKKGRP